MKNRIQTAFAIGFGLLMSGTSQAQEKIEYPTHAIEFVAVCEYERVPYWSVPNGNQSIPISP